MPYSTGNSNPVLCDNLEGGLGREAGGRFRREGTYVFLQLIHVDVWQKLTQHCKAMILQLKYKLKKKKSAGQEKHVLQKQRRNHLLHECGSHILSKPSPFLTLYTCPWGRQINKTFIHITVPSQSFHPLYPHLPCCLH